MTDPAFEKLATRAREILGVAPRPTTEGAATQMLGEIAIEMEVPERLHGAFGERLRPAMVHIVSGVRSQLRGDLLNTASRAYLAKPATPGTASRLAATSEAVSLAVPGVEWEGGPIVAPSAPQVDAQRPIEAQARSAVPAERSDEAATVKSQPKSGAPPATPLSMRATPAVVAVLDGLRLLRHEELYVPGHEGITYGSATLAQWDRRLQWHHDQASGHIDTARKERAIRNAIATAGVRCADELLEAKGEP